jgi:polygalacturonase
VACGTLNVRDFGAVGDGTTDDTAALAAALDKCGRERGGIVFAPTGNYLIKGHLSVPDNVTLEGVFRFAAVEE